MNLKYARRSEDTEQVLVFDWARMNVRRYPELKWLYHVPNGGSRNHAEAVKLKQMGVRPGVSDICLPYSRGVYHGLFLELKFDGGRVQSSQKEFLDDMEAAGFYVCVCYGAENAVKIIEEYLNLSEGPWEHLRKWILDGKCEPEQIQSVSKGITMKQPNNSILK